MNKFNCVSSQIVNSSKIYLINIKTDDYEVEIYVKEYLYSNSNIEIEWEFVAGRDTPKLTDEELDKLDDYIINMEWLK